MKQILIVSLILFASILGFILGYFLYPKETTQPEYKLKMLRTSQNGLINPLVEIEIDSELYKKELVTFHDGVRDLIDKKIAENKVKTIALYFRDLNNGPWFGINEDEAYFPASLLKVPLMIAYLKKAETDPSILGKEIKYDQDYLVKLGNFNNGQFIKSEKYIEPDKTYTVEELINYMIVYSDNNAKNLLVLNLSDPNELFKVYSDLGLSSPPELREGDEILSVHEYSTSYRVLYNASYLNKEMSKKALNLLVKSKFKKGLLRGVPNNTTVANKFGEYSKDNIKQLHDCGIIYYPNNPYLLCIMTRGNDFLELESVIKDISSQVYEEVDKQLNK